MSVFPSQTSFVTGDILTATAMNEIGQAINLLDGAQFAAGKNKIINGDFGIWQRGTSFSNPASASYTADRWIVVYDGTGATRTISQQTFTPGTAPVAGYEGATFLRYAQTVAGTGNTANSIAQRIEDVRAFAGQTVTLSFWAKADAARTVTSYAIQNFGSGGSGDVVTTFAAHSVTTGWTRFTATIAIPSISGKTLGTGSYLSIYYAIGVSPATYSFDIWGVQVEAASTASNFQTATGTKQGELAACQRYYWRSTATEAYSFLSNLGIASSTTITKVGLRYPVTMRSATITVDYANLCLSDGVNFIALTSITSSDRTTDMSNAQCSVASGLTQFRGYSVLANNNAAAYLGVSAEL
jgi:hypothetical protein